MPALTREERHLLDPDGSFLLRLVEDRQTISKLIEIGPLAEIAPIVHRLAGAAGTFGFDELGEISITLDEAFVAGTPVSVAGHIQPLIAAIARAIRIGRKSG